MSMLSQSAIKSTPYCDTVVLSVRVTSGRRRASRELLGWAGQLEGFAGEKLQPGSLNVYLDRPLRLCKAGALRFDGGGRMLWRASLNGLPVLLYRWRECPFHIIEILSAVDLRTQFGLRDGDAVTSPSSRRRSTLSLPWSARCGERFGLGENAGTIPNTITMPSVFILASLNRSRWRKEFSQAWVR